MFTRMEHANRHWMEIFDAISDFIVAHDSADNILRVNRSLADFIGVPPRELIGVNMCALLAMESSAPLRACPFCRGCGRRRPTSMFIPCWVAPSWSPPRACMAIAARACRRSMCSRTSPTGGKRSADIASCSATFRRAYFSPRPKERFIEVNDALVRMLGYSSREEVLQVDVRTQVFSSPEHYRQFAAPMQDSGVVRNHEEALRRKDGSSVHVMVNAFAVRDTKSKDHPISRLDARHHGPKNLSSLSCSESAISPARS